MRLPGLTPATRYLRVRRALYGFPESARLFYRHLRRALDSIGFTVVDGD